MNFNRIYLLVIGVIAGLCGSLVFLCYFNEWSSHRAHAQEIDRAYNDILLPAAAVIRNFEQREHRLPSDEEMERAGLHIGTNGHGDGGISVTTKPEPWMDTWGVIGKDFIVETEVPDWSVSYRSWENKRTESNLP